MVAVDGVGGAIGDGGGEESCRCQLIDAHFFFTAANADDALKVVKGDRNEIIILGRSAWWNSSLLAGCQGHHEFYSIFPLHPANGENIQMHQFGFTQKCCEKITLRTDCVSLPRNGTFMLRKLNHKERKIQDDSNVKRRS